MNSSIIKNMAKKTESISQWMDRHGLNMYTLGQAIDYSPGAVSKWRQEINYPGRRAEKDIRAIWSDFPERPKKCLSQSS